MRVRVRLLRVLCALLLLCGGAGAQSSFPGAQGQAMPGIGQVAPPFALSDLEGRKVSLEEFRGKVVLLNFFAYWCDTWKEELKRLRLLQADHPELEFEILFVAVDSRERSLAEPLMLAQGVAFPIAVDFKAQVSKAYGITTVPTLFVIDAEGVVRASHQGYPGNRLLVRELKGCSRPAAAVAATMQVQEMKEFLLPEELRLWRAVNAERRKRGLVELTLDPGLTEVGREYLQRTASEPLRHASGPQAPDARVRARGIEFAHLGENLARSRDASGAVQAMLTSPNHKSNLLHPRYRQVGVSAFRAPGGNGYSFSLLFLEPPKP